MATLLHLNAWHGPRRFEELDVTVTKVIPVVATQIKCVRILAIIHYGSNAYSNDLDDCKIVNNIKHICT